MLSYEQRESISKEHTHEDSPIKLHGDAESVAYYYLPNAWDFIVKISNKYFKTLEHIMTVLCCSSYKIKSICLPLEAVG